MDILTSLGLTIGAILIVAPLAYIAYLDIGGIYHTMKRRRMADGPESVSSSMSCRIDSDCPPGYVCQNGVCVPENGR